MRCRIEIAIAERRPMLKHRRGGEAVLDCTAAGAERGVKRYAAAQIIR